MIALVVIGLLLLLALVVVWRRRRRAGALRLAAESGAANASTTLPATPEPAGTHPVVSTATETATGAEPD